MHTTPKIRPSDFEEFGRWYAARYRRKKGRAPAKRTIDRKLTALAAIVNSGSPGLMFNRQQWSPGTDRLPARRNTWSAGHLRGPARLVVRAEHAWVGADEGVRTARLRRVPRHPG